MRVSRVRNGTHGLPHGPWNRSGGYRTPRSEVPPTLRCPEPEVGCRVEYGKILHGGNRLESTTLGKGEPRLRGHERGPVSGVGVPTDSQSRSGVGHVPVPLRRFLSSSAVGRTVPGGGLRLQTTAQVSLLLSSVLAATVRHCPPPDYPAPDSRGLPSGLQSRPSLLGSPTRSGVSNSVEGARPRKLPRLSSTSSSVWGVGGGGLRRTTVLDREGPVEVLFVSVDNSFCLDGKIKEAQESP